MAAQLSSATALSFFFRLSRDIYPPLHFLLQQALVQSQAGEVIYVLFPHLKWVRN